MFEILMLENRPTLSPTLFPYAPLFRSVLAGKATAALMLPVSLQIVLRALIEEGLKQDRERGRLNTIDGKTLSARLLRNKKSRAGGPAGERRNLQDGSPRKRRERRSNQR